ncbi:MAG: hypothetical protein SFV23_19105 [Planctomycetaceae bacterium]|nr:hypothetical protein [Planctomycetaceae bacterium]
MPPRFAVEPHEWVISITMPEDHGDIIGVFEFSGHLDFDRLVNAALTAIASEPMWDYRFVEHWMTPYWQSNERHRRRELVSLHTTDDVPRTFREVFARPVETAVTVHVLRAPTGDTLCIRTDHRLSDATSMRLFASEVARNYQVGAVPPPVDGPVIRRTPRLLRKVVSRAERRKLLSELRKLNFNGRRVEGAFALPAESENDRFSPPRHLHYPEGSVTQLTARAFRDRATTGIAIQAALLLALRDVVGLKPGRELPQQQLVDLRRYLPPEEREISACMLIGAVVIWLQDRHADSMETAIAEIRSQLAAQRGPHFGLFLSPLPTDLPLLRDILRWIPYRQIRNGMRKKSNDMSLTPNSQVTDLGNFGQPGDLWEPATLRNAYSTISRRKLPQISIGVSTCGTRLNLALFSGPDSFVQRLAERVDHHLAEYTGWTFGGTPPLPFGEARL